MEEKPKKKANRKPNGSTSKSAKPSVKKISAKAKSQKKVDSKSDSSVEDSDPDASKEEIAALPKPKKKFPNPSPKLAENSDSTLSSLIDEDSQYNNRRKGKEISNKKGENPKSKAKADTDEDPNAAEIKRLQGWLVKCGIRKLWGKELKSYETSKAKIKHLKEMLVDVGMTGRYSQEKANQIKLERELAADIEAVKEGAERWGKDDNGSEDDEKDRPKRRLVRGAQAYDFLSSGGEETD
jgi:hypothetical protein